MAVIDKVSGEVLLQSEDLRKICGGTIDQVQASFPCTVVDADGTTRTKQVSSIQECLDYAGISVSSSTTVM